MADDAARFVELTFPEDRLLGWISVAENEQWNLVGEARGIVRLSSEARHAFTSATNSFGDDDVDALKDVPHLVQMQIDWTRITDAGLAKISAFFPEMEVLDFHETAISDEGLSALAPLQRLRHLWFSGTRVSDNGFTYLAALSALEHISTFENEISDIGLSYLKDLTNLRTVIFLKEPHVTGKGIAYLAASSGLSELRLGSVGATVDGVDWLRFFPMLQKLALSFPEEEVSLASIALLTQLRELHLIGAMFGSDGIRNVANLSELEELDLRASTITDEELRQLQHLRKLKTLCLRWTAVTDDGLQYLAPLVNIESLDLGALPLTGEGLAVLQHFPKLRKLWLDATAINDDALVHLQNATQLRFLSLSGTNVRGDGLRFLSNLSSLEDLQFAGWSSSTPNPVQVGFEKHLSHITALRSLKTLNLMGAALTDESMRDIGSLENLADLNLLWAQVSDKGVAHLKGLRSLKTLSLGQTSISDAILSVIGALPALHFLDIHNTNVTDDRVKQLRAQRPDLSISYAQTQTSWG